MRKSGVLVATLISLPTLVQAADIPSSELPVADFNFVEDLRLESAGWGGFKTVVFAGGGFLSGKDNFGTESFFRSGSLGAAVGYDHQVNKIVFGANLEGMLTNFGGTSRVSYRNTSKWLSTATFKLGYDAGRFMPYLTAGIGFGDFSSERLASGTKDSNVHYGFAGGAGVEAKITEKIFARADYKHFEMGKETYRHSGISPYTIEGSADMFNLGVGYRF